MFPNLYLCYVSLIINTFCATAAKIEPPEDDETFSGYHSNKRVDDLAANRCPLMERKGKTLGFFKISIITEWCCF